VSKKHHYVPRCHLRRFRCAESSDSIYVLDKKDGRSYCASVKDVAAENHFNTLETDRGRVCFEDQFQQCDDRLAQLLEKLTMGAVKQ